MSKRLLIPGCTLLLVLTAQGGHAASGSATSDPFALCPAPVGYDWLAALDLSVDEDLIEADRIDVRGKDVYVLEGGVELRQPGRWLAADRISFTHSTTDYTAEGSVRYADAGVALTADRAEGRGDRSEVSLDGVQYRLRGLRGNGEATRARVQGGIARLDQLTYSTCDAPDPGWQLRAREVNLDRERGVGTARHASLRVGDVPILWLPYARFPIDDRRQTGFLYPTIGYADDSGIDVRLPFYLNLAPNMDATLAPRVLGRRGVMLDAEFRYLTAQHGGKVEASWLPDDDQTGRDRGSFRWRHDGRLTEFWRVHVDLNDVSDDRYFEDFGDSLQGRSISLLASEAGVFGRGPGWRASVLARGWDLIDPLLNDLNEPYREVPRANFGLDRAPLDHLRYGLNAEAVAFSHRLSGLESTFQRGDATRYDLTPWIELPFERAAGYVRPRLAWRHTGYDLSHDWLADLTDCPIADCGFAAPPLFADRSPNRSTAIGSIDAALNFERTTSLFGEAMLQTLQPRLYYLRVPYENQDDLPVFDSRELTFGFDQLFRSNRFSGADRQADANQLTVALSSRWLEQANGRERLALHVGQIRYFDDLRVQLPFEPVDRRSGSAYVGGADLRISDHWSIGVAQQWDPEIDRTVLSGSQIGYRGANGALGNLAYRYRRGVLEQIDGSFALPTGVHWRWVGRWNYSLRDESTLEAFAGVEWQGCCLAWRVLGRHYVRNREGDTSNALYVELELKGLGNFGRSTEDFLQRAILGYTD